MNKITQAFCFVSAFTVFSGCGNSYTSGKLLVPKETITKEEVSEKPKDFEAFNPKVDILFVIDNSGSMTEAQENVSRNAFMFADAISKVSILNYHIGVVTTDMDNCSTHCGRLIGLPRYLDKSTPNFVEVLSNRMEVGINGSGTEALFGPVQAALGPGLENSFNNGFYRQDAFLAVIFITDAMDQSRISGEELMQFLKTKKVEPKRVLGYGVIRKLKEKDICFKDVEPLDGQIEDFLAKVVNADANQNNVLSLCDTNFGAKLAGFAADIVKRATGSVRLSRVPNPKTIKVFYGNQEIPNDPKKGWVFQASTNSILLGDEIDWQDQGLNVGLKIDFEVIDLEKD